MFPSTRTQSPRTLFTGTRTNSRLLGPLYCFAVPKMQRDSPYHTACGRRALETGATELYSSLDPNIWLLCSFQGTMGCDHKNLKSNKRRDIFGG